MIGRRTVGRAIFFGLGYVAGTRAGREQYARIETGAKRIVAALRTRYAEHDAPPPWSGRSSATQASDPYEDIRLGRP